MKLAYFDCYSGASGDMILGALVDAGLPLKVLQERLALLPVEGYELIAYPVLKKGIRATKVDVVIPNAELPARDLKDIRDILKESTLTPAEKETGLRIFSRLAEAEAVVHDCPVEQVHFHELGALDTLVDVMGAVIGFQELGIEKVFVSPMDVGSGMTETAHGRLPIPAPATVELLKGCPLYSSGIGRELVTPTGAAVLSTLSHQFGPMPKMRVESVGYGAGGWDLAEKPNLLRLMLGVESVGEGSGDEVAGVMTVSSSWDLLVAAGGYEGDRVVDLETHIDDLNPQVYEYVMEKLFEAGALDVAVTPIVMKKGRPAHRLNVLGSPDVTGRLMDVLFRETTTLGIRVQSLDRVMLTREERTVSMDRDKVRVKIARRGSSIVRMTPEYEDCKKIAVDRKRPLQEVIEQARRAAEDFRED